jgi:bidirectional [NiFe] hydrogenase diaphorase subunit
MPLERSVFDADPRFELIDAAMKRLQHCPDSLIAILHQAQDQFGYLDAAVLAPIARSLMLPPSRVYGVATFYHLFSTEPPGEHTCVVCLGTACFVQGASKLLERENLLADRPLPRGLRLCPGRRVRRDDPGEAVRRGR